MLAYYESLGRIRQKFAALRRGGFRTLLKADGAGVYAFARAGGADDPIVVALNKRDVSAHVSIPVRGIFADGQTVIDQLSTQRVGVSGGSISLSLPPRTGAVLAAR
jgi:hypothetical protein